MHAAILAPVCNALSLSPNDIVDILGDASDTMCALMAEEYFTARFGDGGEASLVDDYLKRQDWREMATAPRYPEPLRDSAASLYVVVDIDCGRGVTVFDLIRDIQSVVVREKLGSENPGLRDCLAACFISVNWGNVFTGDILRFSRDMTRGDRRCVRQERRGSDKRRPQGAQEAGRQDARGAARRPGSRAVQPAVRSDVRADLDGR